MVNYATCFAIAISTFIHMCHKPLKGAAITEMFQHTRVSNKCQHGLKMTAATSIRAFNGHRSANLTIWDFRRRRRRLANGRLISSSRVLAGDLSFRFTKGRVVFACVVGRDRWRSRWRSFETQKKNERRDSTRMVPRRGKGEARGGND